ncbi:hypothetical protein EMCRGX_G005898 [Ephydatia muelleri]
MTQKSKVVPLGVLLKNENVLDDMVDILDALHKYVPKKTSIQSVDICEESGATRTMDLQIHHFHHILLGGDQLTVARVRGSQGIVSNSYNGSERIEGFIPVIEDWHTKMCYMQVVWKRLYSTCSGYDGGTLFHLRNVINRRIVVTNVKKDLNSCEEFMELVTTAHVLSAAIEITKVDDLSGLSMMILTSNSQDHFDELATVAKNVCKEFCRVSYSSIPHSSSTSSDRVKEYAMESLSLGLFLLEFKDAIREGDGTRVLRCWKYLLIIFRVTGHTNYCLEALNLLTQYYYTLPPRYAEQMLWGRFVNSQGGPGQNISADLHMEHLNRLLKDAMTHLGANKTPQAIVSGYICVCFPKVIYTIPLELYYYQL